MHNALAQAVREYTNSPEKSQRQVVREFNIAQATLNVELTGRHVSDNKAPNRILSVLQETVLIDKINNYASRGTLLTPRHVRSLLRRLRLHDHQRTPTTFVPAQHACQTREPIVEPQVPSTSLK